MSNFTLQNLRHLQTTILSRLSNINRKLFLHRPDKPEVVKKFEKKKSLQADATVRNQQAKTNRVKFTRKII